MTINSNKASYEYKKDTGESYHILDISFGDLLAVYSKEEVESSVIRQFEMAQETLSRKPKTLLMPFDKSKIDWS